MMPSRGLEAGSFFKKGGSGARRRVAAIVCLLVHTSGFVLPVVQHGSTSSRTTHSELEVLPGLTAFEFYSGIGGLRVSLEKAVARDGHSERPAITTSSFEINAVANSVLEHNFPDSTVTRRSIEHLAAQDLDGAADIWLLSPPCQPFCRVGNKMDEQDTRSASFRHLLSLLKSTKKPPSHIFLENVQGFDGSQTHHRLLETLSARGFDVEQFMLSPVQLGIPNTRLRYYCLASRRHSDGEGEVTAIQGSLPQNVIRKQDETPVTLRPLSEFLDPSLTGEAAVPLILTAKAASHANPSLKFDVVTTRSTETTTFTKGYGKHAGRAGPVVLLSDDGERRASEEELGRFPSGLDLGPDGREVRWFSEREMLRIHGFPETFDFPEGLTQRQRCALIGNSVNVEVVALLLRWMLFKGNAQAELEGRVDGLAKAA